MKTNTKKKILEAVSSLEECHVYINSIESQEQLIEILRLCQELALSIGETLESQESQVDIARKIVTQLEAYCDNIYKLNCVEPLHTEEFYDLLKICNSDVQHIKTMIISDVPEEKLVVVFLPYMASMWDSLESICHEAMKNNDWETYVMPVPYYLFNKQRKPIADVCEYDKFPQDLPLIHYKSCSLKKLKPDLLFYHNPYDDLNLITCVHPEFFSRNLKEITPNLVYVPYYFAGDKTMEHMPDMPGAQNAWKVVVQKDIAGQFLEKYPEEKVLPLGSPKLDALFNENTLNIPKEWQRKTKDKTVIFFNTHLTSVMIEPTKFFDMLDYIMELMHNDDEIVILWRPHPLMQQTLTSFQDSTALLNRYREKINKFKSLPNAIYDDTADLHRSIAISDGYMGSANSSVFRLYKETEKPIYVIPDVYKENWVNAKCLYSDRGLLSEDNFVWFFNSNYNAISKYSLNTNTVSYVTTLDRFNFLERNMFFVKCKYKNWLVLVPFTKNYAVFYNICSNEIKYVQLEAKNFTVNQFITAYAAKDKIILIRGNFKEYYYTIEMETFSCTKEYNDEDYTYLGVFDGYIFSYSKNTSTLKLCDVLSLHSFTFLLPKGIFFKEIPFIKIDDGKLWVIDRLSGILYVWDKLHASSQCKVVNLLTGIVKAEIRTCFVSMGKLLISFTNSDSIYSYDINELKCSIIKNETVKSVAPYSRDVLSNENSIILFPLITPNASLTIVNSDHSEVRQLDYNVENIDEINNAICNSYSKSTGSRVVNSLPLPANKWLKLVSKMNNSKLSNNCPKVGAKIWESISKYY